MLQGGRGVALQRAPVGLDRAGLAGAQESAAQLSRGRSGAQDGRERGPVRDRPRRHERALEPRPNQAQQGQDPEPLAIVAVGERGAVSPGLDPLEHEDIGPGPLRDVRLGRIGHGHPHLDPGAPKLGYDLRVGTPEGEGSHRGALAQQQLELGRPVVIVASRLSDLGAVARRLVAQPVQVRPHRGRVRAIPAGDEQVYAEGRRRSLAHLGQVAGHLGPAPVAGGQEAQGPGFRDHDRQRRGRRSSRQGRLHDRVGKLIEDH